MALAELARGACVLAQLRSRRRPRHVRRPAQASKVSAQKKRGGRARRGAAAAAEQTQSERERLEALQRRRRMTNQLLLGFLLFPVWLLGVTWIRSKDPTAKAPTHAPHWHPPRHSSPTASGAAAAFKFKPAIDPRQGRGPRDSDSGADEPERRPVTRLPDAPVPRPAVRRCAVDSKSNRQSSVRRIRVGPGLGRGRESRGGGGGADRDIRAKPEARGRAAAPAPGASGERSGWGGWRRCC